MGLVPRQREDAQGKPSESKEVFSTACHCRPLLHGSRPLPALRERPLWRLRAADLCSAAERLPLRAPAAGPCDGSHGPPRGPPGAHQPPRPSHGWLHGACPHLLECPSQNGNMGAQGAAQDMHSKRLLTASAWL